MGALWLASRFGWKGILIALVVMGVIYGRGSCGHLTGGGADQQSSVQHQPATSQEKATPDEMKSFVSFVFDDVQKSYAKAVPNYSPTRLELFRDSIQSGCGTATEAVGPFYCPIDHKVYIDLTFYDELRERFGAPGDFAQAYVIAHEVGHHVQSLTGILGADGSGGGVKVELQADCLAGAWAKDASERGLVEVGDVDEALNAAAQIGDDTLQRKAGQRVQPETWTHGSSEQRSSSFKKGLEGGVTACGI